MEENERDKGGEVEIWSWGAGTDGQLGTTRLEDEHLPQLLDLPRFSSAGPISLLACGGAHVLALTTDGKVVTWGRGTSGQLGHGDMVSSLQPKHVKLLESFVMTHVSAGWSHSGFVSDTGCLFTCGDGSFGQLGHGDCKSHCSPVKVSYFDSKHVDQIACGMRHSLVLLKGTGLSGDQVYGFGSGKRGQLGVSMDNTRSISVPQATVGLEGVEIISIDANGDHSAALSANGHLYTWGRGFGSTSDVHCPRCLPSSLCFTQVALGWNHMLVLTGGGEVFMLGGNRHGVLGDPQKGSQVKHLSESREENLEKVQGLDGLNVVQIAAGAEHSALVTENRVIKTWGWGEHGQLGLGNTYDQISPQAVRLGHRLPGQHTMIKVYCGSGFTFAIKAVIPSQT
ncbi:ultraviolet-B receptor UVR8 isoform X2 [Vitis vinifera]|uniref:ultraviolet-B receptor UVR8 isoform X2 n=1 Tax=Vitis vinifera TaxID=29760 RepID=UPI00053FFDC9|nr:ultraviolet-B receptor UVR8 isoform X2 [Vitis vinifera]|eukprot:XP_010652539.1 PREDICTED: ultraviolet-B receptor UVR8 isoform X2 [Vitis vinifera]